MHTPGTNQYRINARIYHSAGIGREYANDLLMRAEAVALLSHQPAFAHKDVLDIGVGTGRTAIYLAPIANHYEAIDYSPVMVREFRDNLPGIPVTLADMRDLSQFADAGFDFVLASNNVFDAIGHEDRLQTLRECHRVLRPGGMLMFSSHNADARGARRALAIELSRNPVTQAQLLAHWCLALVNHARLRHQQVFTDTYAIINDSAHDCGLLHYYIGPGHQRQQLRDEGFEPLEVFDRFGAPVPPGAPTAHSQWLLYVARRLAVS
ncbi:MAG TPA: class I SAM-dependent methyltransferase [Rhodanobacteraceae bacterium]|nr:class I SAM-dependent methyltransferase [Rhodanobacteraceae bacterium]